MERRPFVWVRGAAAARVLRSVRKCREAVASILRRPPSPIPPPRSRAVRLAKRARPASRSFAGGHRRGAARSRRMSIGGVGVVPRILDGGRGEGGVAGGSAKVALRAAGQGQGAEGECEGERKEGFHDGLLVRRPSWERSARRPRGIYGRSNSSSSA